MKIKCYSLSLLFFMTSVVVESCSKGFGDIRDKNLKQATLARLDSVPDLKYMGMSDSHELPGNKFQTVIIYYITDSTGTSTEYNVRITTNADCSEIYSWEEMDTHILTDVKQKVNDKMKGKVIDLDGNLIERLIKLKNR